MSWPIWMDSEQKSPSRKCSDGSRIEASGNRSAIARPRNIGRRRCLLFPPEADKKVAFACCPLRAKSGVVHCSTTYTGCNVFVRSPLGAPGSAGSHHCGVPPLLLHSDRNFLRALPCRPLASAWSEHALEVACLPVGLATGAAAEGDGVCADAAAVAMMNDRMVAQNVIDRMVPPFWTRGMKRGALIRSPRRRAAGTIPAPRGPALWPSRDWSPARTWSFVGIAAPRSSVVPFVALVRAAHRFLRLLGSCHRLVR